MIQYEMAFSLSYIFNYHSLTAHLIISSWLNHFAAVAISFSFPPPSSPPLEQIIKLNLQVGTDSFFYIFFYCDCIIRLEFMSHIIIYRLISSWIMYQKQSRGGGKKKKILIVWFKNLHRESLLTIQIFSFVKSSLIGACVFQQSKQKCNAWVWKVSHHLHVSVQ